MNDRHPTIRRGDNHERHSPQAGEDRDETDGWEEAKKLPDDRAYEDRVETEGWERTSAEPGESDDSAGDS